MSKAQIGVVALGNALVDVLAQVPDSFIAQNGLEKGVMTLVDEARALELYGKMPQGLETSGGSAANTMAGFASFGGRGAFIGKVAQDALGGVFQADMQGLGVTHNTAPLKNGAPTGRCMIMVTPDAHRTMNTFLGASVELSPADVDEALIGAAQITYLEGYLFDRPLAKQAFIRAAEIAHKADKRVSLTLSDPFCVDRHRDDFRTLVAQHVDILFANEQEIMSLYQVTDFDAAVKAVGEHCEVAVLTRSEKGAVIVSGGGAIQVAAAPVKTVIDTTGAGDQFAAGFLYGFTQDKSLAECGRLGAIAAAEVISHIGPRPLVKLSSLAA